MVIAVYVNATSQGQVVMADGKAHRTIALSEAGLKLMNEILAHAGDRTAVVAMGSPYLASAFPDVQNYLCTYSIASVSEIAAAKALFGEISIHGHSPVTIPESPTAAPGSIARSSHRIGDEEDFLDELLALFV